MRTAPFIASSIGTMLLATFLLAGLKLTGGTAVAAWSWWWVTAALWGPWVLVSGAALVLGLAVLGDRAMQRLERWARGE